MGGFGTSAFGASPYASGSSSSASTTTAARAASAMLTAKIVDGDTVRDSDGRLTTAEDPIAEEIAFRLGTSPGRFFGVQSIGNGALRVQIANRQSLVATRDAIVRALDPIVRRGDIRNILVTPTPVVRDGTAINFVSVSYDPTNAVRR